MRILAVDHGTKRIGIALSDPLGTTALPVTVIANDAKLFDNIKKLAEDYEAGEIVVGLPKALDGSMGLSAEKVIDFVKKLKGKIRIPVMTYDERLSTAAAQKMLIGADMRRSQRKMVIDKIAAAYMLQSYMDSKKRERKTDE
ncbi:MAG: Holliday junction resolvase RuvX [Candidatus Saganbacteria bacterium]|nr:Holliday junction resolvase RuvX [Candidatus Saganbacteria bacterium]